MFSHFNKKQTNVFKNIKNIQNIKVILQKIKYSVQRFFAKIFGKIREVKQRWERVKSQIENSISNIRTINIKLLLSKLPNVFTKFTKFSQKTDLEVIPEGILGIHINNNHITLVHLVLNNLNDIIVKSRTMFTLDSIDLNLQDLAQKKHIEEIISNYIQNNRLNRAACSCVLLPQQYVLSLIEFPKEQDPTSKEKAILWSIKDYINYSIDDAMLDSFEIPVSRTQDQAKLGYAIATRKKLSEDLGGLINNCGINLKFIDIKELCIRNIIALYPEFKQGVLVLEVSSTNNSILLFQNYALFISRATKLNIAELDNFDPKQGGESDKLSIAENLVLELQRSLDYSNGMFKQVNFNKMVILPHNLNLDLFIEWAQDEVGLPIFTIDLTSKIKFNQEITRLEQANYILAIGAALRDLEHVSAN